MRWRTPSLPPARRALLFRVGSELLMNVAKHAGTGRAQLRLDSDADGEHLVVSDRGQGFDPSAAPGAGCRVEVWLPPAETG